jgi:branched-subunit amino acid ABC-type transport system permease component
MVVVLGGVGTIIGTVAGAGIQMSSLVGGQREENALNLGSTKTVSRFIIRVI